MPAQTGSQGREGVSVVCRLQNAPIARAGRPLELAGSCSRLKRAPSPGGIPGVPFNLSEGLRADELRAHRTGACVGTRARGDVDTCCCCLAPCAHRCTQRQHQQHQQPETATLLHSYDLCCSLHMGPENSGLNKASKDPGSRQKGFLIQM